MRKSNKKKSNKKRIIIFILIIILSYIFLSNSSIFSDIYKNLDILKFSSDYKIIKQDINKNYSGIGQEKINEKDGYFTTFTTEDNYKKTYIEYKQNGNSSWSNNKYWGGTMAENGCRYNCNVNYIKWIWKRLYS